MAPTLTAEQWRDDLHTLTSALRNRHRNPFHTVSEHALARRERTLHGRIPMLHAHEIVVEMSRIVAMIGDGHTVLRLGSVAWFRRYPATFYRYSNGLFVRSITPDHPSALGARLLSIDGTPADDALAAMRPFISRDNEMGVIATAPQYLSIPEVVHAGGIARDMESVTAEVGHPDGTISMLVLSPEPTNTRSLVTLVNRADRPTPLSLERGEENWFRYIAEHRTMYCAFNAVADGDGETVADLFDRLFAAITEHGAERLVLDLRRNGGGNNLLNQALIHHLLRCPSIDRWGGLFVLIGRVTFSAAMNLAVDLERHTRAIFVGEPTGSSPNHYGENGVEVLPHSGIEVSISTLLWQTSLPFDDRPWIAPDISVRLSSTQEAMHIDPAMDAVLTCDPTAIPQHGYPDRIFAQIFPARSRDAFDTFR